MSLPKWMMDAGADPALWLDCGNNSTVKHVTDDGCWMYSYEGYADFRVPEALAPAIIKLVEGHLPKPPSSIEGQALAAELVNKLGPSGLAQFIQAVSNLGEAPTARAVLQCATHAFRTENGIDGMHAPALQRAEKWLEQSKEVSE